LKYLHVHYGLGIQAITMSLSAYKGELLTLLSPVARIAAR
jgi:hypothetical protein